MFSENNRPISVDQRRFRTQIPEELHSVFGILNEGERSQSVLRRRSIYQAALWKSHRIHLSLLPWECPVREAYSAGLVAACAWASSASPDCGRSVVFFFSGALAAIMRGILSAIMLQFLMSIIYHHLLLHSEP